MALNTGPLNSASLNSSGQSEFTTQGVATAALGFLAITAALTVIQPANAQAEVDVSSSADGFISTYISEPTIIGVASVASPKRLVFPVVSAGIAWDSFANVRREVLAESSLVFGLESTARQSVTQPAQGTISVDVLAYSLAINVLQNGIGDSLTDIATTGYADVTRRFFGESMVDVETSSLDGLVTRYFSSDAQLGVAASGGISVRQPASASSSITFSSIGQDTRQQYAIGTPARVEVTSSEVIPSIVQYVDALASFGVAIEPVSMRVEQQAYPAPIIVRVETTGWVLDEVFVSRIKFSPTALGSYNHLSSASGLFGIESSSAQADMTRFMRGEVSIGIKANAEPAINGEHEATASSTFGFSASTDALRVLHNIQVFGTIDFFGSALPSHISMTKGTSLFSLEAVLAAFSITTYGEGQVDITLDSIGDVFRTRLFFGQASSRLDTFEFSTTFVGVRGQATTSFVSTTAEAMVFRSANGISNITFEQQGQGRRVRYVEGQALIDLLSARAQALSNLTVSASLIRTFKLDSRQSEFEVPFEDRRFIV